MNEKQFELLATLLKSREPVTSAARLILLEGERNITAATLYGVFPQSVHRSVVRFEKLHAELQKVYGGLKNKQS